MSYLPLTTHYNAHLHIMCFVFLCVRVCVRLLLLQIGFGFTLFVNYNLFSLNSYLFTHAPFPFTNTLTHKGTHLRTNMFTPNNQYN